MRARSVDAGREDAQVIENFDSAGWRIISLQMGDVIEASAMRPRWQFS